MLFFIHRQEKSSLTMLRATYGATKKVPKIFQAPIRDMCSREAQFFQFCQGLDFAQFDCYACHHDLQAANGASWRQRRRTDGSPGRPMPSEWPLVLVPLGIAATAAETAAAESDQFRRHQSALNHGFKIKPFGDAETTAKASRDFVNWIDSVLDRLQRATIDDRDAHGFLVRLGEIASERVPDYSSARQLAWAFRIIYDESTPKTRRDPKIEAELAELEFELALNLPPMRSQSLIEASLPDRLRSAAKFDPESFQAHFRRITAQLTRR